MKSTRRGFLGMIAALSAVAVAPKAEAAGRSDESTSHMSNPPSAMHAQDSNDRAMGVLPVCPNPIASPLTSGAPAVHPVSEVPLAGPLYFDHADGLFKRGAVVAIPEGARIEPLGGIVKGEMHTGPLMQDKA